MTVTSTPAPTARMDIHAVAPQLNSHDVQRLTAYDPAALAVVWSAARAGAPVPTGAPAHPWALPHLSSVLEVGKAE